MLVRNVGHLMTTPIILNQDNTGNWRGNYGWSNNIFNSYS